MNQQPTRSKSVAVLLTALQRAGLTNADQIWPTLERKITSITDDSRQVDQDSLFVAVRGYEVDGHQFINTAVAMGSQVIVCETVPPMTPNATTALFVQVSDTRRALAVLAATFYDHPAGELKMIGVTGTNGKTTTTFLIHQMLQKMEIKAGLLGTIVYKFGDIEQTATHTTPGPVVLNKLLRQMVDVGCSVCVMEVSSHALDQDRVYDIPFDIAAFTNLTHEHLDYHHTLEAYLEAKKILFNGLSKDAFAVINTDDPAGEKIIENNDVKVIRFGQETGNDIQWKMIENRLNGMNLSINGNEHQFKLAGGFNASNISTALGISQALGLNQAKTIDVLGTIPPIPGRFECLSFKDGSTAIVDYAHTPDAYENVFKAIKQTNPSELWCIFGCGGDRDAAKRPLMAAISEKYADHVIVTRDNPRTESLSQITADIRRGFKDPESVNWITNRDEGVAYAAKNMSAGGVLLMVGKGHENYQIIGTEKVYFSDTEEIKKHFTSRGLNA